MAFTPGNQCSFSQFASLQIMICLNRQKKSLLWSIKQPALVQIGRIAKFYYAGQRLSRRKHDSYQLSTIYTNEKKIKGMLAHTIKDKNPFPLIYLHRYMLYLCDIVIQCALPSLHVHLEICIQTLNSKSLLKYH